MIRHFYYRDVIKTPDYCLRELICNLRQFITKPDLDDFGTIYELYEFGPYLFMHNDISDSRFYFGYDMNGILRDARMLMDGACIMKAFTNNTSGQNINTVIQTILKALPGTSRDENGFVVQEQSKQVKAVLNLAKTALYQVGAFKRENKVLEGAMLDYSPIVPYVGTSDTTLKDIPQEPLSKMYPNYTNLVYGIRPPYTGPMEDLYYSLGAILLNSDKMVDDTVNENCIELSKDILKIFDSKELDIPQLYYIHMYITHYIALRHNAPFDFEKVREMLKTQLDAVSYLHNSPTNTESTMENTLEAFSLLSGNDVIYDAKRFNSILNKYSE